VKRSSALVFVRDAGDVVQLVVRLGSAWEWMGTHPQLLLVDVLVVHLGSGTQSLNKSMGRRPTALAGVTSLNWVLIVATL
jgi:hypothetical protein